MSWACQIWRLLHLSPHHPSSSLHLDQPFILPVPSVCGSIVLLTPRLYPSRGDPPCQHHELSPHVYQTVLSTSIVRHPCPASPPPECELPCPETLCLRSFCPEHSVVAELRRRCLPTCLSGLRLNQPLPPHSPVWFQFTCRAMLQPEAES